MLVLFNPKKYACKQAFTKRFYSLMDKTSNQQHIQLLKRGFKLGERLT